MVARRFLLLGLLLSGWGCLGRVIPILPPVANIQSIEECPASKCPEGGVVVTIGGGNADAEAIVTAYIDEGNDAGTGLLGGNAHATTEGVWAITIGPRREMGVLRVPRRGQTIRVFQSNELGQSSSSATIQIPTR
jgi:hypothetical protein